mmetsp:Transcript_21109/g.42069  ORF Transcript_21109/g.42069 Transcript_21109/m.42069 type:complete len:319 (-) Transcript_21109:74-1030(-)
MNESMIPPDADIGETFFSQRRFGATFSVKELERRGLDWREAFDCVQDLGLNALRLGAYWSDIEPEHGVFDFEQLDELLHKCEAMNIQVLLTLGMKGPRWPEFHIPAWAQTDYDGEDITADSQLCDQCLDFIEAVVNHVKDSKCIIAFQVENEPLDKAGEKRQIVGIDFVAKECNLIRSLDPLLRPIVITAWCWSFKHDGDVKDALRHANVLGLDVYTKVRGDDTTGEQRSGLLPRHYKALANSKGREAWVTECQAEPWNPSHFERDDLELLLAKLGKAKFDTVFLWGFEKWLDSKLNKDDDEMWNAVKAAATDHFTKR